VKKQIFIITSFDDIKYIRWVDYYNYDDSLYMMMRVRVRVRGLGENDIGNSKEKGCGVKGTINYLSNDGR